MNRLAFAALILLSACAPVTTSPSGPGTISGIVTYTPAIPLAPGTAEVHVSLIDGTAPGLPAVAETSQPVGGQIPIAFTIDYDGSAIVRDHHYYLRAEIREIATGRATLATAEDVPVIPGMLNAVELTLQPATTIATGE